MTGEAMVELAGPLAQVSLRVAFDHLRPNQDRLPKPTRLVWAGVDLALDDAELSISEGTLVLKIFDGGPMGPIEVWRRMRVLNQPARLTLADETSVHATFAHGVRSGTITRRDGTERGGLELELSPWEWLPSDTSKLVFTGRLHGLGKPPGDNLVLKSGESRSAGHLRLEGALTWHIIRDRGGDCQAAVSFGSVAMTTFAVRCDLAALDFVAGRSLDLPLLWAVDEHGRTVGAMGTGRPPPITHRTRIPVPAGPVVTDCWAAPFFTLLAKHTALEKTPIDTALTGYLDALRGHIHGGYLLAQVALEVFCRANVPPHAVLPLVESTKDWIAWVDEHEVEIAAFAANSEDRTVLLKKLRNNVIQRPTGEVVQRAFTEWGLALPEHVVKEIAKRNPAVHKFMMFDEVHGDVQEAADRVDMVQMLLAAAIAKHVAYAGPVVGWERDESGHLVVPEFWPSSEIPAARTRFLCSRSTNLV